MTTLPFQLREVQAFRKSWSLPPFFNVSYVAPELHELDRQTRYQGVRGAAICGTNIRQP